MSIFTSLLGPLTEAFNKWRDRKHEIKMADHELKKTEIVAEADVRKAKADAEIRMWSERQSADISWELESIKNSSWKDEYLTLFTTAIILATFIPYAQEYVATGFNILTNNTPIWFQVMAAVVWSSAFGVRVFTSFKDIVTTKNNK